MFSDNFRRGEGGGDKKTGSRAASKIADLGWKAFQAVNKLAPEGKSIQPSWAAEPLLKSYERTAPPLGFPRETDSLCPKCVKQVRETAIRADDARAPWRYPPTSSTLQHLPRATRFRRNRARPESAARPWRR